MSAVNDLFPVDDRRAYLAGLSGTARQAMLGRDTARELTDELRRTVR